MHRPIKVGMYLLSLWLLFVLIFVNKVTIDICFDCKFANKQELVEIAKANVLPLICVGLLLVSGACYFRFRYLIAGAQDGPLCIESIEDKNAEHLVFLATYVVPLVGFGLDNVRQMINLGITLCLLGALYVRTNLFYANPTLALLGFRIFNVTFKDGPAILIANTVLEKGEAVNVLKLDRNIYFATLAIKVAHEDSRRTKEQS
ncbi:anti-phage protein KwaA [Variovorax sp. RCC_210]|uniref:anti-phage protein KwaA n=1 Tax=Variovorax sp. RCC_210 TaxID=3239217 RepID=UPI003523F3EF